MTEEDNKLLVNLREQIQRLIFLHEDIKRKNSELRQLLESERLRNETIQAKYDELSKNYADMQTATAISLKGSDVKETKLRLSKLVREVDKCIALLNE